MQDNGHQEDERHPAITDYICLDKQLPDLIAKYEVLDGLIPGVYGPKSSFHNPPDLIDMTNQPETSFAGAISHISDILKDIGPALHVHCFIQR